MESYRDAQIYQYGTRLYDNDDPIVGMYFVRVHASIPSPPHSSGFRTESYYLCRDLQYRGAALDEQELRKLPRPTPIEYLQSPRSGYFDNEQQAQLYVRLWNKRNPNGRPRASHSTV